MFVASSGKLSITLLAAKNKEKPLPRPAHPLLARSQHLSPPAQYPGGLGVPCPGDSAPLSRKGAPPSPVPFSGFSCLILYQGGPATPEGLGKLPPVCM